MACCKVELLRHLDVCVAPREHTLKVQSILRRKRDNEFWISSEVGDYEVLRNWAKKSIHTAIWNLKCMENKCTLNNHYDQPVAILSSLKKMEIVSLTVFEFLLCFIVGTKAKQSSWFLVKRLMQSGRLALDRAVEINEFENVDAELTRRSIKLNVENLRKGLGKLESSIQEQEEGLECFTGIR